MRLNHKTLIRYNILIHNYEQQPDEKDNWHWIR